MTIPNILTFSRFLLTPLICFLLTLPSYKARLMAFSLFLVAAVTDFLDGYLAKTTNTRSSIGAFLDPLADKALITMVFFFMAGVGLLSQDLLWPCGLILTREILVLGLRGYVGSHSLPVVTSAKWKTHCQLVAAALLIYPWDLSFTSGIMLARISLWMAVILGFWSGYLYIQKMLGLARHLSDPF